MEEEKQKDHKSSATSILDIIEEMVKYIDTQDAKEEIE